MAVSEIKISEEELHFTTAAYLERVLDPDRVLWFHTPNQGMRHVSFRMKLKRMGLLPGVPDWYLAWGLADLFEHTGWIELKAKDSYPTREQRRFHERARCIGQRVAVCRSLDEVDAALRSWMVPMRGRVC